MNINWTAIEIALSKFNTIVIIIIVIIILNIVIGSSGRPYMCRPAAGSGCQRVDESEQTQANAPVTGSKRARKEESGRPDVCGPAAGSGCQTVDDSEQTQASAPATGSKRARKEESERPGVIGVPAGGGCHRGLGDEAHANVGDSDGRCPLEYLIVDSPDDNSVTKTAAHGRRSVNTSPVIIDLDARQDPSSSSFQKRTDDISCPEADTVSCLSACEVP